MVQILIPRISAQAPFLQNVPSSLVSPEWYRLLTALTQVAVNTTTSGVTGPAASVDGAVALFDGTSGGAIKDSKTTLDNDAALAADSATRIATQRAVKTYADTQDAATLASAKAYTDVAVQRFSHNFLLMGA
jgi:hypothetical protein